MKRTLIAILIVLALSATHMLWADDDAYDELDLFDLILGIIENPDPIPQIHWVSLTADPNSPDAREAGERLDGRPAFEFNRKTEDPYVTWAYDMGTDHDIAFNTWKGNGWHRRIEFVTSSTVDEVDPRLYVDSHNHVYLTWWEDDPGSRIMLAKRSGYGYGWDMSINIGNGRRPSVAVWQGDLVVAYERDNALGQEIVFARSSMGGPFVPEVVAVTTRTTRLDPIVHVRAGVMWIDWKEADNVIAYSAYQNGVWKIPLAKAWNDPSWLGELTVRHMIELQLTD